MHINMHLWHAFVNGGQMINKLDDHDRSIQLFPL